MSSTFLRSALVFAFHALLSVAVLGQMDQHTSVLTQHNNPQRNGVYSREVTLRPDTVGSGNPNGRFQSLCIRKVDARVFAQPLYASQLAIGGANKNALIVVTGNNTVYGFEADNTNPLVDGMLWPPLTLTLKDPDGHKVPGTQDILELHAEPLSEEPGTKGCNQTKGPVGIMATPVIDPASATLYVVARFAHPKVLLSGSIRENRTALDRDFGKKAFYCLVAIDLTTGREKRRVLIDASEFHGSAELNRPGLLLMNGIIYIAFGAPVCDASESPDGKAVDRNAPHGFVLAYSVPDLAFLASYNTSPQTSLAGIWQSGAGLAGDPRTNSVFALTGNNGDSDFIHYCQTGVAPTGYVCNRTNSDLPPHLPPLAPADPPYDDLYHRKRTELGESFLKLSLQSDGFKCDTEDYDGCVTEHFTAGNWYRLDSGFQAPATNPPEYPALDKQRHDACAWVYRSLANRPSSLADACDFKGDSDLGSGGPVVLLNGFVLGGGKQGRIYILDPKDMKRAKHTFQAGWNTWHLDTGGYACSLQSPIFEPNCVINPEEYDFSQDWGPNIHGAPVVWQRQNSDFGFIYLMAEKDFLRGYKIHKDGQVEPNQAGKSPLTTESITLFDPALISAFGGGSGSPILHNSPRPAKLRSPDGMPGGAVSLSSNGDSDAIVWVSVSPKPATYGVLPGALMAFEATSLRLLWSDVDPQISFAKFVPPTIAGGKVFRATYGDGHSDPACDPAKNASGEKSCGSIVIYGLRPRLNIKHNR